MARTDPQVNFRIPLELKEKIEKAAADSGRSITSELITRLDASFAEETTDNTKDKSIRVQLDDKWFEASGLTADEFGAFVRMAVQSGVTKYKVDG